MRNVTVLVDGDTIYVSEITICEMVIFLLVGVLRSPKFAKRLPFTVDPLIVAVSNGGLPILYYIVTSIPPGIHATGAHCSCFLVDLNRSFSRHFESDRVLG